jgi:Ser/Thr protein kinase RdoA (MazF antagonist)
LQGLQQIGIFLGRLNRALAGFSHPAAGHFMPWDSTNDLIFRSQLMDLIPDEARQLVGTILHRLQTRTFPALKRLPRQVVHQDGHGGNLLRDSADSEHVAGMIDFGDMVHGPLIADLAVTAASFVEGSEVPAAVVGALCQGFHGVIPLSAAETDLLLDLMMARQIVTLQLNEFRRRHMEHPPEFISKDNPRVLASLKTLAALDSEEFAQRLRQACA